jgi:hypothetical protein
VHNVLQMVLDHVVARRAAGEEVDEGLARIAGIADLMIHMYEDEGREASFAEAMEAWVQCEIDDREEP